MACAALLAAVGTGQAADSPTLSSGGAGKKPASAEGTAGKPNILVIWGDDIGWSNISAYNDGMMGYKTPNIDRIAKEGALFTDAYAQQSCTAGRSSFILGQNPFRTGLLTIGMPGSPHGIPDWTPTIADLLKEQGYTTGQFGKNHLGDLNKFLPTVHGFDEFFGNLYHLNAEEEPDTYYYPKDPDFKKKYGPRGVLHCWATNTDDTTEDAWGKIGKQKIENTGPLTVERMKTIDDELYAAADKFIDKAVNDKKPFFVWFNTTRMHVWTHLKKESIGKTGIGLYPDGMVEHDALVGQLLKRLDDLGIADNTIVVYGTDNGAEVGTWPDGGTTPFHGEKGTTWEGGFRVPMLVRWPGVIKAGTIINDIFSQEDWMPTLLAAAGTSPRADYPPDGINLLPILTGAAPPQPRTLYWRYKANAQRAIRDGDMKFLKILDNTFLFNVVEDPLERANLKGRQPDVYDRLVNKWLEWNQTMLPEVDESSTGGITGAVQADHVGAGPATRKADNPGPPPAK